MSEFQYYEFRAVDRPLSDADRKALRALSTRARITATSFVNTYSWGDLKGDPAEWMERWFDLHLYFSNWGTRILMIRLPRLLFDPGELERLLDGNDSVRVRVAKEHLLLEITRGSEEPDEYEWYDEDQAWRLDEIAPVRAELLAGDPRLFSLLWLLTVEEDLLTGEPMDPANWDPLASFDLLAGELDDAERPEPVEGLGPLTPALAAVATFLRLDGDLVQAAAERPYAASNPSDEDVRRVIAGLPDDERTGLLVRLYDNDALAAAELRWTVRQRAAPAADASGTGSRTAGEILVRAWPLRKERRRAEAEAAEAERRREAARADKARRVRLDLLRTRGDAVWAEVEPEIERRNGPGHDRAAPLITDMAALAEETDRFEDFSHRLDDIRDRHARKARFLERVADL